MHFCPVNRVISPNGSLSINGMSEEPRGRLWIFTYYPSNVPFRGEPRPQFVRERLEYLRANPETCPETGRFHWQGFAVCRHRMRSSTFQKALGIYPCRTALAEEPDRCKAYCEKEDSRDEGVEPVEGGIYERGGQGKRTDLERIGWAARQGFSLREIAVRAPSQFIRYHGGIERLVGMYQHPTFRRPRVYVFWGDTGSGKTREVFRRWNHQDIYVKSVNTKWFDLYHSQRVLLMDEFSDGVTGRDQPFPYATILRLCDMYPYIVEPKGGARYISFEVIVFTSEQPPTVWFGPHQDISSFMRRVTEIRRFTL